MSFIEFDNVCKYYTMGETRIAAADHISFFAERGEFCVIVGPSGAGKTTVLNMLGGMDTCDEGRIILDGREISGYNPRQLTAYRRLEVGFVFQFYNLVQNLTALENVELASEICPDPLDARKTLEGVGLGDRLHNFPAQLSGGESSGCLSPGPWLKTRRFYYVTSPPAPLTTTPARPYSGFCRTHAAGPGARF